MFDRTGWFERSYLEENWCEKHLQASGFQCSKCRAPIDKGYEVFGHCSVVLEVFQAQLSPLSGVSRETMRLSPSAFGHSQTSWASWECLATRVAESAQDGCVAGLDFLDYMSGWQNKVKSIRRSEAKIKMLLYSPELKMPLLQYRLEARMVCKAPHPLTMLGSLLLQCLWRGGAHALQTKLFSRFIQPCWVELDLFCG